MCTYLTETIKITGSGKGAEGWFSVSDASVYFDHPVHAMAEHTLNIDFRNPVEGPAARVAVELSAESARELARAIVADPRLRAAGNGGLSLPVPLFGVTVAGPCQDQAQSVSWPCRIDGVGQRRPEAP